MAKVKQLGWHETEAKRFRNKPAQSYMENYLPGVLAKHGIRVVGVTLLYGAEALTQEEAWKRVALDVRQVHRILQREEDVQYVLSAIEEHGGKGAGEGKGTLAGYPHLHVEVGYANLTGTYRDAQEYGKALFGMFADVQVGAKKKKKGQDMDEPVALTKYVLKNCRHEGVKKKLGAEAEAWQVVLNTAKAPADVTRVLAGLKGYSCPMGEITRDTAKKVLGEEPAETKLSLKKVSTELEEALAKVKYVMEKNELRVNKGKVYRRREGTKMTWVLWSAEGGEEGSVRDFVGHTLTEANAVVLKYMGKIEEAMGLAGQRIFPTLELDAHWVELADGYYNVAEGWLTAENDKYPCFAYFGKISMKKLQEEPESVRPREFERVLDNSFGAAQKAEIKRDFYATLLPKVAKARCLYLIGEANSGKTTLIDTVARVLPLDKRHYLTNSKFSLTGIEEKLVVVIDEGGIWMLTEDQLLKLMEGNAHLSVDEKHKRARTLMVNVNMVFLSNEDVFEGRGAGHGAVNPYEVRTKKYHFRTLVGAEPGGKELVLAEQGEVILWLSREYFGRADYETVGKEEAEKRYERWRKEHGGKSGQRELKL